MNVPKSLSNIIVIFGGRDKFSIKLDGLNIIEKRRLYTNFANVFLNSRGVVCLENIGLRKYP